MKIDSKMKNNRRDFIKKAGLAGLSFAGGSLFGNMAIAQNPDQKGKRNSLSMNVNMDNGDETLIGAYGDW
ncbi:MAG: twin-arginine translocation signal domain-containing protein, partial [Bacteroidetes bacterium]|nr:twin-arginine translocation signal domain-containing protein [Bacteroidota bacterium]